MEVCKEAKLVRLGMVTEDDLCEINKLARGTLRADEVYVFTVKLCDNEVDRDGERFSAETLEQLSMLFVGKSGIFDHEWSTLGQTARIYRTQVVGEERLTAAGDAYRYLKGWAYMLRTEKNGELIAEIEGGIKKEVSVGVRVARSVCSICGDESGTCEHVRGRCYDGRLCFAELREALDAYEWSFVAVPAQREAGVMKGKRTDTLRECVKRYGAPALTHELATLEKQANAGRRYLSLLRGEVKRLMLMAEEQLDGGVAETLVQRLDEPELQELARIYRMRTEKKLGLRPQLNSAADRRADDGAFRV